MVLAYELLGTLGTAAPIREMGWDQGTFMGPAAALAIGHMLGFTEDQLANAMSLSMVPHIPLFVTRVGALSMWKGCSTAGAMRNAIFAVELAAAGMTGPAEPFEGRSGLFDQVSGPFTFTLPANPGGPMIVELSYMKLFPAEGPSQALLGTVPRIREFTTAGEIEAIEIETFGHALRTMGSDPAKWDPQTRETADHSLPYVLAVGIVDGDVTRASFTEERVLDPSLRPLMKKISIAENEQFSAEYAPAGRELFGTPRARITVRTRSGDVFSEEVTYPRGHPQNPMTRADVDRKLDAACDGSVSDAQREEIREAWWSFATAADVDTPMATLRALRPANA
jgi:2-methylcitrate dehydratase